MRNIISKADLLALIGSHVEHEDLLNIIIEGLGDEFRANVDMINGRDTPIGLEELHEKLLHRENTLLVTEPLSLQSLPVRANTVHYRPQYATRGNYRGSSPARGNYRGGRGYQDKCQLCGNFGHSATQCSQLASSPMNQQFSSLPATPYYRGSQQSPMSPS